MKTKYIAATFLVAGFAAGFAFPRKYAQRPSSDSGNPESVEFRPTLTRKDRTSSAAGAFENSASAPIGELLDKAFAAQSEIRGTRYLIRALDQHRSDTASNFAAYFSAIPFSREQLHYWRLFFSSWGTFDGPAALAYIQKRFDEPALQKMFYHSVLKSWDKEAPGDALGASGDFLVAIPGATGDLAKEFIRDLLARDHAKGIEQMVRLSDPEAVMEMAGLQLMEMTRNNLQSALEQLGQVDGEAKLYLTGQLANAWSAIDPNAATAWLAGQGYPKISSKDLNTLVANYVKVNPSAAFEWINKLPESLYSETLLQYAAQGWATADPAATQAWLAKHQPAAEFDPVVAAIVQNMAKKNPADALNAASTQIHDAAKGQELFFSLAMDWKQRQPIEFTRWLEDTSLVSSPQKQRLLNREFHGDGEAQNPAAPRTEAALTNGR